MKTWVDATERSERGKPAGVFPSALHWPSGKVGGAGAAWWRPENYDLGLYAWPGTIGMLNNTLLLGYHMTGNDDYLKPLKSMATIRTQYANDPRLKTAPEGSIRWCADEIGDFLPESLAKCRWLTGDRQFDDLLGASAEGYMNFVLTGSEASLEQRFLKNAEALRYNFESFTSETRFTDRILRFVDGHLQKLYDTPIPRFDPTFLYSTLTGDYGNPLYFPLNAIRWLTHSKDIAALVHVNEKDRFQAALYHFGLYPRAMGAELYLLREGTYRVQVTQSEEILHDTEVALQGPGSRVFFQLLSQHLYTLTLSKL